MSAFQLSPVDRAAQITREQFHNDYLVAATPVVFRSFASQWEATQKWTLAYFQQYHGDIIVPLYSVAFANSGRSYMRPETQMRLADYIDLIQSEPSQLRMFLFNILRHIPALCDDFDYPDLDINFLKGFPFMFFGGETSVVDAHFDADLSHVFLTQFQGRKRVILFSPENSAYLYRHPLTVSTNVDIGKPDLERYPLLRGLKGLECTLDAGDTLFIPSGYWHYVYYESAGFALSLRAQPASVVKRVQGVLNIGKLKILDHMIGRCLGSDRWYGYKESLAVAKANRLPPNTPVATS